MLIGVISDTHGLLRPEAVNALQGSDLILHAGDVGDPAILDRLRAIAPVTAIRGNVDEHGPCRHLPAIEFFEAEGFTLYMLHDRKQLDLNPLAAGFQCVISGHSHKPGIERRAGVLYLNPGSAGPRRFQLPVSIAKLHVTTGDLAPEIVLLMDQAAGCFLAPVRTSQPYTPVCATYTV